jgi:hypothetical protein
MNVGSHELLRGLVIAFPILVLSGLGLLRRWLRKRNAEISAILQRHDE